MSKLAVPAVIAGLSLALAACGSGSGDEPTQAATTAPPAAAKGDLTAFLLKPGEEPTFDRIDEPIADDSVDSQPLPAEGIENLKRNGFIRTLFAPMQATTGNGGVGSVTLFKTEAGALAQLAYETSTKGIRDQLADAARRENVKDESKGSKIVRFSVEEIPTARGWSGLDIHGNRIGNVFWVQGRCMLAIANEGRGDFSKPLSAGALAIWKRTEGQCP